MHTKCIAAAVANEAPKAAAADATAKWKGYEMS